MALTARRPADITPGETPQSSRPAADAETNGAADAPVSNESSATAPAAEADHETFPERGCCCKPGMFHGTLDF